MRLIELRNGELEPTEELFFIRCFRELWELDSSREKERFFMTLGIIYHMSDPRSSYAYITDEGERFKKIKEQEGLSDSYEMSDLVKECIRWYKEHVRTTTMLLLENARLACDKISVFLRDVDFTKNDKSGKPLYTINSVTSALKQIPQIAKDLSETEKIVNMEMMELDGRARGGNERKKVFEDGVI